MTSVQIPVSIAAALPNLTVLDITNEVGSEIARSGGSGIAYISPNGDPSVIRVQERETGFFSDLECMLERFVPLRTDERERMISMLLGPADGADPVHRRVPVPRPVATDPARRVRVSLQRRVDAHDRLVAVVSPEFDCPGGSDRRRTPGGIPAS